MYETLGGITMSQEVALNADDYSHIFKWYELVFAGGGRSPSGKERNTFIKISAMAMGYTEDVKKMTSDKEDEP